MKADFKNPKWRPQRTALKRCCTLESVLACIVVIGMLNGLSANPVAVCNSDECAQFALEVLHKMNTEVNPCDNFYEHACGNYIKNTKIPDDKSSVNSFTEVSDVVQKQLYDIIRKKRPEADPKHLRFPSVLYDACMNTKIIERLGRKPIEVIAKELGGWPVIDGANWDRNKTWNWQETVIKFGRFGFSISYIFDVFVQVDIKNSTKYIITLDQSSTALKQKYLSMGWTNPLNYDYLKYMIDMALLFGANLETAIQDLEKSLQFEIDLAKISWPMEERRNFSNLYNLRSIKQLQQLYPYVNWLFYINAFLPDGVNVDENEMVILSVPSFFDNLGKLLNSTDNRVIANYLMWRLHHDSADLLSEKIRNKKFQFNIALTGKKEEGPRWKRCAKTVLDSLTIAVGSLYVREYVDQGSKRIVLEMVENIRHAFGSLLDQAKWMDITTKRRAKEKLQSMTAHVGYPDELLDDDKLEEYYRKLNDFDPDKYFESVLALNVFESENSFGKLKLQVNKSDWVLHADPALADAYYTPVENGIIIPAGILQGNFFNSNRSKFSNFGGIGSLIGHELTHGFDDKGRQFDLNGNLINWWQPDTEKAFLKKAQCIINQYGNYKDTQTGLNLNGNNTLGENIADLGGYKEAYLAYTRLLDKNGEEPKLPGLEKYSSRQMFWLFLTQMRCAKHRKEFLEAIIETGFHAPENFRVLGPLRSIDDFSRDFQCTSGTPMNPVNKCSLCFHLSLGSLYVRKHFDPQSKVDALKMVNNIRHAFEQTIQQSQWMDIVTKRGALNKVNSITAHVGYPAEILNDTKLEHKFRKMQPIDPEKYFAAALKINFIKNFYSLRNLRRPVVKKNDWTMYANPIDINAYYSGTENSIDVSASILQDPFFNSEVPDALNYGAMGTFVSHEFSHGFDTNSHRYDDEGDLTDWWQPEAKRIYLEKVQCLIEQYGNITDEQTGLKLDGVQSQNENLADNSGTKPAYLAFKRLIKENGEEPQLPGLNFTSLQLFWIAKARAWCVAYKNEHLEHEIRNENHLPNKYRVLVPLQNMPEFSKDFNCAAGTPMNPEKKCEFW